MKCVCGSDAIMCKGGKTYCIGCFDAGMRFGIDNIEQIKKIDEDVEKIRANLDKFDEVVR
jgi:hypothetical protein